MESRRIKFIDYAYWYRLEKSRIDTLLTDCLERGQLMLRQEVEDFERDLARYVGVPYAVAVSNCTDALRLTLLAAGIQPGDEVITSAHTFAATVSAIVQAGGVPVLADIKRSDHLIDVRSIRTLITPRTRFVLPVSLNGRVADLEEIEELAQRRGLQVIEDAAQALGATRNGRMAGSFGLAGCFSFYPAKTLGALGDAGAVTTRSEELYKKLKLLRNHCRGADGDITQWGYNCRMDNLQAAVLGYRLTRLESYIEKRRHLAQLYRRGLGDVTELRLPPDDRNEPANRDAYQNFEFEADQRDALVAHLRMRGIEIILPWGGRAIHHLSAYTGPREHLREADAVFRRIMTLPLHIGLSDEDVAYVIACVREFYGRA